MTNDPFQSKITIYCDYEGCHAPPEVRDHPEYLEEASPQSRFWRHEKGEMTLSRAYADMSGCFVAAENDQYLRFLVGASHGFAFSIETDPANFVVRKESEPFTLSREEIGEPVFDLVLPMFATEEEGYRNVVGVFRIASAVLDEDGDSRLHAIVDRMGEPVLVQIDRPQMDTADLLLHLEAKGMLEGPVADLIGTKVVDAVRQEIRLRQAPTPGM